MFFLLITFPDWSSALHLQNKNQTLRTFCRKNNTVFGNGPKDIFDWSTISLDLLLLAGNFADMLHFHSKLCGKRNSSCRFWQYKQFIMIRNLVPMKETVTDFCCVLEFMDITCSCTVFGNLVGPFIFISSKTKILQIIIEWNINWFYHKRQRALSN